jgi:hypothetical protein
MPIRVVVLTAVLLLATASQASATVVPQRSIKGVQLGASKQQVRATLGAPDKIVTRRNEITGRDLGYRYGLTEVVFAARGNAVTAIVTTSRAERTASGVGVGSSAASVVAGVPGVRCRTEFGLRHCSVGRFEPGRVVTDFMIGPLGRVVRIVLGRVID